ncbi:ATPase inhibitor B, mitochondrial [Silurus asotus]|uniref:ATPase inhibitor B, mitochondrial n=1 Tax=Silurus asotus TaxID=30991 RepID=A0AAD5A199_SILAS|nr:ATPase inhibitor B, mitochondrial [Silurus asotus]
MQRIHCGDPYREKPKEKEKEQEQIAALRKSRQEIINHHKKQIEDLQKEIHFHERKLEKLKQHESE